MVGEFDIIQPLRLVFETLLDDANFQQLIFDGIPAGIRFGEGCVELVERLFPGAAINQRLGQLVHAPVELFPQLDTENLFGLLLEVLLFPFDIGNRLTHLLGSPGGHAKPEFILQSRLIQAETDQCCYKIFHVRGVIGL